MKFVEDFWADFCAFWDLLARAKGNRKANGDAGYIAKCEERCKM